MTILINMIFGNPQKATHINCRDSQAWVKMIFARVASQEKFQFLENYNHQFEARDHTYEITFHGCHLVRAIVLHAWEQKQERRPRPSTSRPRTTMDRRSCDRSPIVYKKSTRRLSRGRCRAMHRRGCTWFREGEFRGHNKTTTSPAGSTAILLLLSVFLALSFSLFSFSSTPVFHPLFRAFTLSLSLSLEIPTDTDRHRRICS